MTFTKEQIQRLRYILADLAASLIVWVLFFLYRVFVLHLNFYPPDRWFWTLMVVYPICWSSLFWLSGYYQQVFRKSRLAEFFSTLFTVIIGSIFLFFFMILNDPVDNYDGYYRSIEVLFALQFIITYFFRFVITQHATYKIQNRKWVSNTLVVGTGSAAQQVYSELSNLQKSLGYNIVGYVYIDGKKTVPRSKILGLLSDLDFIMNNYKIDEVIVAIEDDQRKHYFQILEKLYPYKKTILAVPTLQDIIIGGVKNTAIYATPLVNISCSTMPYWQQNLKKLADVFISIFALILLSPLLVFSAIRVKMSSEGPIIYKQKRLGFQRKPFYIYKFRSMFNSAESQNVRLTEKDDFRLTEWGKIMRKYRIDEFPQFFNVLRGEMSIVGPRPEQEYFANQIQKQDANYGLIYNVKPGITSWGMVKFGYANTVDQMLKRLKYDYIYIQNMTIFVDIKIMIYTLKTIFLGEGK